VFTLPSPTPSCKYPILGVDVDLLDNYPDWLMARLTHQQGTHVVTLNAEMTMQAGRDPQLASIIDAADLVIPDGAGVVLYLKLFGQSVDRCPGIELAETLLRQGATLSTPATVFFYGGEPGVTEDAAKRWQRDLPTIAIAGTAHGYLNDEEQQSLLAQLETLQPQIILVGLGVPRQEYWIAAHRHRCPNAIWMGIGGSFDIWSERKERAPVWLCRLNLEWTYRLYQEPWRWQRMLALPQFALCALRERLR
jgi:N-acetylglucosaminyldiphosphoundecaprenol N-acetyl-beta-D-mannosaminyltransferase